ncbi:MAG: hypothetical protein AB7L09_02845 [Nitrospira sp.]
MSQFALTPQTTLLVEFLRKAEAEGRTEIPYAELSALIDTNVQVQPGYGYLRTARRRLIDDDNSVWGVRQKIGLYLVPAGERARWGNDVVRHKIRRTTRRGAKVMRAADFSQCDESDILSFNTAGIWMSMIDDITKTRKVKALETTVSKSPQSEQMSVNDTLRFLGLKRVEDQPTN